MAKKVTATSFSIVCQRVGKTFIVVPDSELKIYNNNRYDYYVVEDKQDETKTDFADAASAEKYATDNKVKYLTVIEEERLWKNL